jgi:hypothetical protein
MPKRWKPPKKVVFASDKELGYYQPWVGEIIQTIRDVTGEPLDFLFISDQSMIGDMPPEDEDLKKMAKILGIPIDGHDLILDLTKQLKKSME